MGNGKKMSQSAETFVTASASLAVFTCSEVIFPLPSGYQLQTTSLLGVRFCVLLCDGVLSSLTLQVLCVPSQSL